MQVLYMDAATVAAGAETNSNRAHSKSRDGSSNATFDGGVIKSRHRRIQHLTDGELAKRAKRATNEQQQYRYRSRCGRRLPKNKCLL